jgi:hypothetical protein
MPSKKQIAKKIFKVKRKTLDDDRNNFVVRFKGPFSKQELKDLRVVIDESCAAFMHDLSRPKQVEEKDEY